MKPTSSLLTKILAWFFLNLLLVAAALGVFFAFQPHIDLHAIFGRQGDMRLRTAGRLITHDLNQTQSENWQAIISRHAIIHGVDFTLVLTDGTHFSSSDSALPAPVIQKLKGIMPPGPPRSRMRPRHMQGGQHRRPHSPGFDPQNGRLPPEAMERRPPRPNENGRTKRNLRMRTQDPTRYWSGIPLRLPPGPSRPMMPAVLLAASGSITGNGFFFDPLPWMVVAGAITVISVLLWIPMVRNISRPLGRMTYAMEQIAKGRFDVAIHEPRKDEIGRLAKGINHMSTRLSAFVNGQKRFLGDVSHELGSPIARIQFGLGALEQRVEKKNRQRVKDVMEDVDHMSKLVNELLAFSRADMTSTTVRLDTIELLPVVRTAIKRERTPGVDIITQIDPQIRIVASAELVTRAVANLIRNAVKYAADAGRIQVSAQQKAYSVDIEVLDQGPGVPEHLLNQLFEPFFRPEASRDRDTGGVGLGLAIVKTCIEACKGEVIARNADPKGFAVTITLPAP